MKLKSFKENPRGGNFIYEMELSNGVVGRQGKSLDATVVLRIDNVNPSNIKFGCEFQILADVIRDSPKEVFKDYAQYLRSAADQLEKIGSEICIPF